MNWNNQKLLAIKTTKNEYQNKIKNETDEKKKKIYAAMIKELEKIEKETLEEENLLLDNLEKGE